MGEIGERWRKKSRSVLLGHHTEEEGAQFDYPSASRLPRAVGVEQPGDSGRTSKLTSLTATTLPYQRETLSTLISVSPLSVLLPKFPRQSPRDLDAVVGFDAPRPGATPTGGAHFALEETSVIGMAISVDVWSLRGRRRVG